MSRKPLMEYLPELYREVREFEGLTAAEDAELASLGEAIGKWQDDQFVWTSGEAAVKRREKQLAIMADPQSETLEFRKIRIINRYSTKPPFTERYLQDRLDFLFGPGKAQVQVDVHSCVLTIAVSIPDASFFKEMEYTIKAVKPAHLVYNQSTALGAQIGLRESVYKIPLARRTTLGTSWKLGQTPFAERGQEVQVK
ncbi:putative phage tail protein [Paenibacillus hodogayensis]|uniref:Phage tail protein n=1 Tax=Paenibacillus hodogayensis TaxID=279208 RepID=A0ABV5W1D4_9BACL